PSIGYWIGVSIYGLLGAFVASIMADGTAKDAFKLGIMAPALVFSFANGATNQNRQNQAAVELISISAYAQPVEKMDSPQDIRNVSLNVSKVNGLQDTIIAPFEVTFQKD